MTHPITLARARAAYEASCVFYGLAANNWKLPAVRAYWLAIVAAIDAETNDTVFASARERRTVLNYPPYRKRAR